jgi:HlyD family secretion protein
MTRRTKVVLGLTLVALLLVITSIGLANSRNRAIDVRAEEVGRRDLVSTVTASGYIQPRRKVDISADISGRVTDLYVEEGQWVDRGDLLLRIDPTTFEANVGRASASVAQSRAQAAQTRANLTRAESELARAEQLAPRDLISPADLEQARTQVLVVQAQMDAAEFGVAQAEAGLAEAREQLRKTTIAAPMSGHVTRLNIQLGETAVVGTMNNAGSLLLTIADLSEMEARVRVGETDIPVLTNGDSATVRIDAYPNKVFTGRVDRIANSAVNAPSTRGQSSGQAQTTQTIDFEVIVLLADPPPGLRPDLTATADIVTAKRPRAIAIPIIAVTVRDEEGGRYRSSANGDRSENGAGSTEVEGVFVHREGRIEWVPVSVGIVGDWYFEVLSGVEPGDTVISGPYAAVRDLEVGTTVRLTQVDRPGGGEE